MTKIRHRIFEIYASLDEATAALTPKVERAARESGAPESWDFAHLTVTRSTGVTRVQFKETNDFDEATLTALRSDFAQLADKLDIDSKVLVDFTGVNLLHTPFIDALLQFSKQLRTKGSRIALCCLAPSSLAAFFAPDERDRPGLGL